MLSYRGLLVQTIETDWGWIAAMGKEQVLHFLTMGQPDEQSAITATSSGSLSELPEPRRWHPRLEKLLRSYVAGKFVDLNEIEIELGHLTPFQQKIIAHCRKIPYGETLSYGELARKAGSPGAARAVGSVMAKNRFPLIVPCHRVVSAGGKLGGFSAPAGTNLKQQLLDLEAKARQKQTARA